MAPKKVDKKEKKRLYAQKLYDLLDTYNNILLCDADNVGSAHMQIIRKNLRGRGVLLMGKNTQIRRALREIMESRPDLESLIPKIKLNVGLVFTNEDLSDMKQLLEDNQKEAPARVGAIAPCDVVIPKGDTGLIPTETAFLQALQISTKINKGQIQILQPKLIIERGQKVGQSEATLCKKLNIRPFKYGLQVTTCFSEGETFDVAVLSITPDVILSKFCNAATNVACISLSVGIPTLASLPHSIKNAYKNIMNLALALEGYDADWDHIKQIKEMLENPDAFKVAAPVEQNEDDNNDDNDDDDDDDDDDSDGDVFGGGGLFGGDSDDSDSDGGGGLFG